MRVPVAAPTSGFSVHHSKLRKADLAALTSAFASNMVTLGRVSEQTLRLFQSNLDVADDHMVAMHMMMAGTRRLLKDVLADAKD